MVGWHHSLNGHEFEQTFGGQLEKGKPRVLQSKGSQRVRHNWATVQQQKDEETKLRGQARSPKPHSSKVAEPEFELNSGFTPLFLSHLY